MEAVSSQPVEESVFQRLNLPEQYRQLIRDRVLVDRYQAQFHRVEASVRGPAVMQLPGRWRDARFLRIVKPEASAARMDCLASLPARLVPLRGYRAPILDRADECPPFAPPANGATAPERAAAERVAERLAIDGLIATLAQAAAILGPPRLLTNGPGAMAALEAVGLPWDLLACFSRDPTSSLTNAVVEVVRRVAVRVADGATPEDLRAEFRGAPFRFRRALPGFRVALEDGAEEPALVRMQAGGGYQDGIIPGGSIDAINQIIAALPDANFLISVPAMVAAPYQDMARRSWRLRRPGQAVIVVEPAPISAWAQDNGKAGSVPGVSGPPRAATLAPRYACIDEGVSTFEPGESFLMDGLRAANHAVAHSSLLFQGGNLLAVTDPVDGGRLLFVGEGELYRNMALGLSREQAQEAFRAEFGVDRVVVLPAVSYHLDYDVCVRGGTNGPTVFVNDTMAAVRIILAQGVDALERHGSLDAGAASRTRADLAAGRDREAQARLADAVKRAQQGRGEVPADLARHFGGEAIDAPAANAQCFLLALDFCEASLAGYRRPEVGGIRAEYLDALRRIDAARQRQVEALARLGWKCVRVPSMPDLPLSLNYLNGIHHREGYLLPVIKGFHTPLDQAAMAVFRRALGPQARLAAIHTAACQRNHGGVHCVAAIYP